MKTSEFTIITSGDISDVDKVANDLFEAGCDDATLSLQKGNLVLDFHREANTFSSALEPAIKSILGCGLTIKSTTRSNV